MASPVNVMTSLGMSWTRQSNQQDPLAISLTISISLISLIYIDITIWWVFHSCSMIISSTCCLTYSIFLIMSLGHFWKWDAHQLKKHLKFPTVLVSRIPYISSSTNHSLSVPDVWCLKPQKIMLTSCEITTKSPFSSSTDRAVDKSAAAHHFPGHGTGTTNKAICVEEPTETPMAKSNFLAKTRNPPHAPKRVKSREISWNLMKSREIWWNLVKFFQKEFLLQKGICLGFQCLSMCFTFKIPTKTLQK